MGILSKARLVGFMKKTPNLTLLGQVGYGILSKV